MLQAVQALRNVAAGTDRADMDDLVALHMTAQTLKQSYGAFQLELPEWLKAAEDTLGKEIRSRRRDYLESQLKAAKARQEALKTSEEKRKDTAAEIERLQKALAE